MREAVDGKLMGLHEFWQAHPDELWTLIVARESAENEKWDELYELLD